MAPVVLGNSELLCCSCIWTYVPNCNLQCLLKSIFDPVTMAQGLNVVCMPSFQGKLFSQNTALYVISTIRRCGNCSNGNVLVIALILSFTVHIYLSISGMCSSRAVVLKFIPAASMYFLMHSNCPSTSTCRILKPLP